MKRIIIMSLLATIVIGKELDLNSTKTVDANLTQIVETSAPKNPKAYEALGNVIYNNVQNIQKLKEIEIFESFDEKILSYSSRVEKAKEQGFKLESGKKRVDKLGYLNTLRELSKENDYFIRSAKNAYKASIEKEDSQLFSNIVNSGMIDTEKHKDEILSYYLSHSEDINASGVIQNFLDDQKTNTKTNKYTYEQAKKLREEAKIRRIREDDKRKQAELEQMLTKEVKQKKIEIRENQKKELFN